LEAQRAVGERLDLGLLDGQTEIDAIEFGDRKPIRTPAPSDSVT